MSDWRDAPGVQQPTQKNTIAQPQKGDSCAMYAGCAFLFVIAIFVVIVVFGSGVH